MLYSRGVLLYICATLLPILRSAAVQDTSAFVKSLGLDGAEASQVAAAVQGFSNPWTATQRSGAACTASRVVFSKAFTASGSSEYVDRSSPNYASRIDVNWSKNCWLNASCIVSPSSAAEVANALRIITFTGSKFAMRSGGHNPNPGFGSIGSPGILIDMVNMNILQVSPDNKTVAIGPGNRWENVYHGLSGTGVFAIGGRVPPVGVGGLMLGGGMPFFSSLYGLAADGVEDYEVVLADSSIVHANARTNPDLFWALKGGGPNFGIVTKYTVDAVPANKVWFESRFYNVNQTADLLKSLVDYQAAAEKDPNANLVWTAVATGTLVGFIYAKPVVEPAVFSMFYPIPYVVASTPSTIGTQADLADAYANVIPLTPSKFVTCSTILTPNLQAYQQSYAQFLTIRDSVSASFGGSMTWGFQPFQSSAVNVGYSRGGNALGLSPVAQSWFTTSIQYTDEANSKAALAAIQATCASVKKASSAHGAALPNLFMNDANSQQHVLASYGPGNLAKLKAASQKYDPAQVFQHLQNNGFLVSKA